MPDTKKFNLPRILASNCLIAASILLASCASDRDISSWDANKLYTEAQKDFDSADYSRTIRYYERLEGIATGTILAQQAQLNKAYAHYKNDEKALAVATLNRFMKLHPFSPAMDYAIYLKGVIYFNDDLGFLGKFIKQDLSDRDSVASKQSYESFRQLITLFPNSKYAEDANNRMNYIIDSLAKHELEVANYYYKHKAYVAAINRSKIIITEYQGSSLREQAMYLMAQSYKQLKLDQAYTETIDELKNNYPNSKYLNFKGELKSDKSWWKFW